MATKVPIGLIDTSRVGTMLNHGHLLKLMVLRIKTAGRYQTKL